MTSPDRSARRTPAPRLVWLRNDLRLHDHAPLTEAARGGAPVAAVWCLDPVLLAEQQGDGIPAELPRTGAHRWRFLCEALADLRGSLRAIGGELVIRAGTPETVLTALAAECGADTVHAHVELAPEERASERRVQRALESAGVRFVPHHGQTLVHPDDLPFAMSQLPPVFTKFRFAIEKRFDRDEAPRLALPSPRALTAPALAPGDLPTLASLGIEEPPADPRATWRAEGGERAGLARLRSWTWERDRLRRYKATRNGMLDPDDASRFSPWLAHGCLSPRRVYEEVRRYERERVRNEDTHWLIVELLWRDYFRFVLAKEKGRLFDRGGLQELRLPWRDPSRDGDAAADFARWTQGTTGFPLVDAAMQELAATGFTTNRTRQNVASFLTKNLGIDWRAGAAWFEAQLVDYDVASNWGNWAYAAGVGNDARGFRFFNLHKQSRDYDADGAYVRHWLPALRRVPLPHVHHPETLDAAGQAAAGVRIGRGADADYPAPMVDLFASAAEQERRYLRATGGGSEHRLVGRGRRR